MRLISAALITILSFSSFAFVAETNLSLSDCPKAQSPADVDFCSSFKEVAFCHCAAIGIPRFICKNMNTLYNAMILHYGSVDKACAAQNDTTKQVCLDSWSCYRKGGNDSQKNLCSGTGEACK